MQKEKKMKILKKEDFYNRKMNKNSDIIYTNQSY
jgi:hypothetical protein